MELSVYQHIVSHHRQRQRLLAILLDPDKQMHLTGDQLHAADLVLIGGSTGSIADAYIQHVRSLCECPIVLFPGNRQQLSGQADAILYHSLLSGRNADLLVGQQIAAARAVKQSGIEVIPMGYILVEGGCISSVQRYSHTLPLSQDAVDEIVDTAIAAELMGKRLVYLEAGSGALYPVSATVIRQVRQQISIPLIVGGGIRTPEQMIAAFNAGADIVVIGNHFEQHPEDITTFARRKHD